MKGSKSWFTNIRNTEKLLNIQQLEIYNKGAFINMLQTFYRNKLEKSVEHIKKSSDSKLELFSILYSNFNVSCYLNMHLSKAKRSLIIKLRLSCHNLSIETLRYCQPKVQRHKRFWMPWHGRIRRTFYFTLSKYDSLRNKSKFIAETVQELGKGTAAVRHILNLQTKQYCKSVIHFLDDALNIR